MSSTNRGYDRHKSDYYVTPLDTIYRFFNAYSAVDGFNPSGKLILDPCAGGGVINEKDYDMPYPLALSSKFDCLNLITLDIRQDSRASIKRDFLKEIPDELKIGFDLIITNPPFDIATEIVERAKLYLNDKPDSRIVMLQRLNWLGSKSRQKFWTENRPEYVFVDNKRPSFGGTSGTDSIEYAHFVFKKQTSQETKLIMVHEYN